MKLKSPLVIATELKRVNNAIIELNKQLETMEDEDVKHLCTLSLFELKIRKSQLEWFFK